MKIYNAVDFIQGEGAWLGLRIGKVTASEMGNILTNKPKETEGKGRFTYLCSKLAEMYRGIPNPSFTSKATDNGTEYEMEARATASDLCQAEISYVGFCESDDGLSGCSPDGLIEKDWIDGSGVNQGPGGIEIKCPGPINATRYLLDGTLPDDYYMQVHASMAVTGRKWWLFFSYSQKLPPFLLMVRRDEAVCRTIKQAVANFHRELESGIQKLKSKQ